MSKQRRKIKKRKRRQLYRKRLRGHYIARKVFGTQGAKRHRAGT